MGETSTHEHAREHARGETERSGKRGKGKAKVGPFLIHSTTTGSIFRSLKVPLRPSRSTATQPRNNEPPPPPPINPSTPDPLPPSPSSPPPPPSSPLPRASILASPPPPHQSGSSSRPRCRPIRQGNDSRSLSGWRTRSPRCGSRFVSAVGNGNGWYQLLLLRTKKKKKRRRRKRRL